MKLSIQMSIGLRQLTTMKLLLVVIVVSIGVCISNPVPQVPGDNSHYVVGVSRYIWMNDDQGEPKLVDLQQPADENTLLERNGANNRYFLYTRQNPSSPREIFQNNANSIAASGYVASRPLAVLIHGWTGNINSPMNPLITSHLLALQDCNVLVVDWGDTASLDYVRAVMSVPSVGQHVGHFLTWLINTSGTNWNNVHLIGFSLGAHVVGSAGRTTGSLPIRVTGLDPAGPLWHSSGNRLQASDGQYVEAIHTDSSFQGIGFPIADADFFPNGGGHINILGHQPGCDSSACNHARAVEFFAASVRFNHLIGRQCTDANQAAHNACSGTAVHMANNVLTKRGNGIFALRTGSVWPF